MTDGRMTDGRWQNDGWQMAGRESTAAARAGDRGSDPDTAHRAVLHARHADKHPEAGEHRRGAGTRTGVCAARGGFDLSQGAMLALTAAATAHLAQRGVPPVAAGTAALAIGALLGSINGVMVAVVRTNPFVTTLSTLLIFRGTAFIFILGGQPLSHIRVFQAIDSGFTLGTTFL